MIAASIVRSRGLEPTLDVIAMGHHEGLLISNFATPERDSILELLPGLVDRTDPDARRLAQIVCQVAAINGNQTDRAKDVCGLLDNLATDLRAFEANDPARQRTGSQALAHALRPHLRTLADATTVDREVAAAFREVVRITTGISRAALTSRALAHQLGRKRFAVLQDVIAEDRS